MSRTMHDSKAGRGRYGACSTGVSASYDGSDCVNTVDWYTVCRPPSPNTLSMGCCASSNSNSSMGNTVQRKHFSERCAILCDMKSLQCAAKCPSPVRLMLVCVCDVPTAEKATPSSTASSELLLLCEVFPITDATFPLPWSLFILSMDELCEKGTIHTAK
uniref:Nitric oxide-associated protein 1 n=1 Tax=Lygus hesperus TaxID=30085 RepID=A0A0A9Z3K2_LYGHE